jgi:hypothetical protein
MSFTNATAAIAAKNAFLIDIKEQLNINFANENNKTFEGMKIRLKSANTIAKILNKRLTSVFDTILAVDKTTVIGRLLSTFYLKMHEMITDSLNCHRRDYINGEKNILKIKNYALRLNKNARKCMDIVYNLMSKINNKSDIPSYDEIVSKHNYVVSNYWFRPRKPVNYIEDEDANFDDASDEDYVEEEYNILYDNKFKKINDIVTYVVNKEFVQRPKRNIPRIDYSGMDEENDDKFDEDYIDIKKDEDDDDYELESCVDDDDDDDIVEDFVDDDADKQFVSDYFNDPDYIDTENADDSNDDDSEYIPSDEDEFDDDHVLEFDDDDYAEESEEDDDDYEDEDELRKEDLEFLNDYHNDSDYAVENVENDDDSEYIPDSEDELEDDHILNFDDDDYAEESEEEDDDYEDSETDDIEDKKFVSDYFNDPDYEPNEDAEEDDNIELENDFNLKHNANIVKQKKSNDLVLKAGIEEDEDYNPEDDCEDEDDEEVMYACMNKNENKVSVCKRFYDRQSERVHYRWITMTKAEFDNKYDEEYTEVNV